MAPCKRARCVAEDWSSVPTIYTGQLAASCNSSALCVHSQRETHNFKKKKCSQSGSWMWENCLPHIMAFLLALCESFSEERRTHTSQKGNPGQTKVMTTPLSNLVNHWTTEATIRGRSEGSLTGRGITQNQLHVKRHTTGREKNTSPRLNEQEPKSTES